MSCKSLTSGGGFARVDMSDDDDVDMSLFFTIRVNERLATVIRTRGDMNSMSTMRAQAVMDFAYPIVTVDRKVVLKSCSSLEETRRNQENAQIPRPNA